MLKIVLVFQMYYILKEFTTFSISVQFIAILMVINALSVCVSVMFTSLLLTRPLPQIPLWLQKVARKTNRNGPSLKGIKMRKTSKNTSQITEDQLKQIKVANGDTEMRDLIDTVADIRSEMQKITKKLEETNKDEDLETQWKEIASRLNKLLFLLFSLVLVILQLVGFFHITKY